MRRRNIESMTARSRGLPLSVVASMVGGGDLNMGAWNLFIWDVAVKVRVEKRGRDFRSVVAVKLQIDCIHPTLYGSNGLSISKWKNSRLSVCESISRVSDSFVSNSEPCAKEFGALRLIENIARGADNPPKIISEIFRELANFVDLLQIPRRLSQWDRKRV